MTSSRTWISQCGVVSETRHWFRPAHLVLLQSQAGGQSLVFDLAHHSSQYIPTSAAPDRPESPITAFAAASSSSAARTESAATTSVSSGSSDRRSSPLEIDSGRGRAAGVELQPLPRTSRRRRRRSSSPDPSEYSSSGAGGTDRGQDRSRTASEEQSISRQHARSEGHPPSPKRRRLANMRPDGGVSNANGFSEASNGLATSPRRKSTISGSLNGQSPSRGASNGQSQTNGSVKPAPTYFGHDREEVTRILIQSLYDLGYNGAAATLSEESGYKLESPAVAEFRSAVLDGRWAEAEKILLEAFHFDGGGGATGGNNWDKLVLAENANKNEMLFCLKQQKFLELLEARDLGAALMVLRHELTPLNYNIPQLHALSR